MIDTILQAGKAEARDYQTRIVEKVAGYFNDGIRSAIVNSPTGSGKTFMGLAIAKWLQLEHGVGVGWVAMRRNLLSQASNENAKLGIECEDVAFTSMFAREPAVTDFAGRPIELLVVDEAQHDAAHSMATIHNIIKPKWILGLTATPYRTDRVKLCFDKIVKDIGIHQLIREGYLSQYHQYTIPQWDVETVVATYLREPERWGKSAIYFHKREDAQACVDQLKQAGVRAETIYGDHPQSIREERLAAFEQGRIDVLVNMMILTEGWDSPGLKTVFVRDSQKGPTIQMAGRVFRKYPGVEFKQVVQSKLTKYPINREAEPAESFVWMADSWRSYKKSPAIRSVSRRAMITLAQTPQVEMPDFIKQRAENAPHWSQDMMVVEGHAIEEDDE